MLAERHAGNQSGLLGVRPVGKGVGDTIVRAAARRSSTIAAAIEKPGANDDRALAIQAAMKRPWTGERVASTIAIWIAVLVIVGSFVVSQARWSDLFTFWGNLPILLGKDDLWPPTFGIYRLDQVVERVTIRPAQTLKFGGAKIGTLAPGAVADITICTVADRPIQLLDSTKDPRTGRQAIDVVNTIKGGRLVDQRAS